MIVATVKALAKWMLKGIAFLLAVLILLYVVFKVWDYRTLQSKQAERQAFQAQQKIKYDDLTKDQVSYVPLMVGTSSLDYVTNGDRSFIFSYLLSADFKVFKEAIEESAQMVYVGKQILGSGCKKQACNELEAAFVIDPEVNQYFAAISQNGAVVYYGVEEGKPIPPAFAKWHPKKSAEEVK